MSIARRIRVQEVKTLSEGSSKLKMTTLEWLRSDGNWQVQHRETYDRGNGAALLPYDPRRRTVVLTRQFRYATFVYGHDDLMIEAIAGKLEGAAPEERIREEAEEETGYRLGAIRKIGEAFTSPGSVTEKMHFFVADYDPSMRVGAGGGLADEGEDIEVLEVAFEEALAMIADGRIVDAKTIVLLQHAALHIFK
jgi:nudix-type nucleoside diphosphatase (YffH/AdpP family)